ncbi:DUF4389 domain-containing protein [Blastococcus sp. VKM Ac-2987]|uniref:DUF4389 domain-containing protein n=1 Tax=Blastococcus sp. VKM Ac-2987 TaxID=3004141 RepID=UPI0022ABA86D|nr:DUF4389 domain-containing protein [Blastococcus sp. VKM Ac-2987]MCZ2860604.1 DUF4389 domain-containing protein [Blastococcus sp. VKM Ac-2987]
MTEHREPYPVRVDGILDPPLSRWLWLVKWLLLLPHYVVLAFLWVAFVVLTVGAFVAILVTGRYPRAVFDFNVGVLRWSWRVHYYGYAALGTDRYPPFSLADDPDYPARLDVPRPERLSRGLVLVKSWLLALPHYVVLALFVGGGVWFGTAGTAGGAWDDGWAAGGLVALLVLVAGVVLLFTGRYPAPVHEFVVGMDRWALRVAAYAALMTDRYPPFRLDMGGTDPGHAPVPPPVATGPSTGTSAGEPQGATTTGTAPAGTSRSHWTGGRIVSVVAGALLLTLSTGLLFGGGGLLWADQTQREDGVLLSGDVAVDVDGYAVASDDIELDVDGGQWVLDDFLGTARVIATPADAGDQLFLGVGRSSDVAGYLAGVRHSRMDGIGPRDEGWQGGGGGMDEGRLQERPGVAPGTPPGAADVWVASTSGPGTQVLDWRPTDGDWTVVLMRADGAAGIDADVRAGATVPGLTGLAAGLLVAGGVLFAAGALLVVLAVHRARLTPPDAGTGAVPPAPAPPAPGGTAPVLSGGAAPRG